LLLSLAKLPNEEGLRSTDRSLAASTQLGLIPAAAGTAVALAVPWLAPALLPVSLAMPLLLLQDAIRYRGFARSRPAVPLVSDTLWLIGIAAGSLWATSLWGYSLAWAGAGALAAVVCIRPSWWTRHLFRCQAMPWLREHRSSGGFLWVEFITVSAVQQAATWVVAGTASLAAAGALRTGQALVSPLRLVSTAATVALMPRAVGQDRVRLVRSAIRYGAANGLLAVTFAGVLWVVPDDVGQAALGDTWVSARPVAALLVVAAGLSAVSQACLLIMKATGSFKESLRTRVPTAIVGLAAVTLGALFGAAVGAAIGLLASAAVGVVMWLLAARRALGKIAVAERDAEGAREHAG
jgi:O-antigen/teichoic acid export membrane protein